MPLTTKEQDKILEQYTHTMEEFDDERKLLASEEVRRFEIDYAGDAQLTEWMRQAKEKKLQFLREMSARQN